MTDDVRIIEGDCLAVLPTLPDGSVDAVVTDPPYSSGGLFRGDRMARTDSKYTQTEHAGRRPDFQGDNRDQRSWAYWCCLWMSECLRIVKPSGYLLCFTDWRQLPSLTDAVQAGGWIWRGIAVWDKTESARPPHTGYFRHQCEYIVWATNGVSQPNDLGPWAGCFRVPVKQADKHHQTGKPTSLMRELTKVAPRTGTILDPFAGSGTTGIAALLEGRKAILIEREPAYVEIIRKRIADTVPPLFAQQKEM